VDENIEDSKEKVPEAFESLFVTNEEVNETSETGGGKPTEGSESLFVTNENLDVEDSSCGASMIDEARISGKEYGKPTIDCALPLEDATAMLMERLNAEAESRPTSSFISSEESKQLEQERSRACRVVQNPRQQKQHPNRAIPNRKNNSKSIIVGASQLARRRRSTKLQRSKNTFGGLEASNSFHSTTSQSSTTSNSPAENFACTSAVTSTMATVSVGELAVRNVEYNVFGHPTERNVCCLRGSTLSSPLR
jgi:hypothetical protein